MIFLRLFLFEIDSYIIFAIVKLSNIINYGQNYKYEHSLNISMVIRYYHICGLCLLYNTCHICSDSHH